MRYDTLVRALISTLTVGACTLAAQAPRSTGPDSLPRELVEALLRSGISAYGGDGSEFVVGRVPTSLAPFLYVPRDANVLGGVENSSNTVAVFKVKMTREELRTTYGRELPRLGWTPSSGRPGMGWGFMPAPGSGPNGSGFEYCHIGQSLQITANEIPFGVSVTAVVRNYGGTCAGRVAFVPVSPGGVVMPRLINPPDAGMNQPSCYQPQPLGVGSARGISERLETSITADKLLEHFARQLADSGWSPAGAQAASVRRTWTHADTGGTIREITLSITPMANSVCQEVSMQVREVSKR